VTWAGVRIFDGRQPRPGALLAGATLWIGASQIPGLLDSGGLRSLLSACIIAGFSWAAAFEFWRGRGESLMSRWPAILLLFAHGAMFLLSRPLSAAIPDLGAQQTSLLRQRVANDFERGGPAVFHRNPIRPACNGQGAD
jgi:hypothetical protein